jgi:t-SNARE complex subunit (syntaxin)
VLHIRGGNQAEAIARSVTTMKNEFNSYVVVVAVVVVVVVVVKVLFQC